MSRLTTEKLEFFRAHGFVVLEDVLSEEEVSQVREQFHAQLASRGIHHDKVLSGEQTLLDGPRVKGNAASIFYARWKLNVHMHERVYALCRDLLVATFGSGKRPLYEHPFGAFEDVIAFIDRVCYRLPDVVREEGGLELHIDRNPTDPYLLRGGGLKKWRPIQALLTLTDHFGSESGGLKVVRGFQHITDQYFADKTYQGEFCRLHDKALQRKLEPVHAPKGSLVFWDNRLPHATSQKLGGSDTREVVYIGYLPQVDTNRQYAQWQAMRLRENRFPPAFATEEDDELADRDWQIPELSDLQRRLLCL